MRLFASGIVITTNENHALRHLLVNPEQRIRDGITSKIADRKTALVDEWRPTLFDDDSVTSIPGSEDEIVALIFSRSDYKTRLEKDTLEGNDRTKLSTAKYSAVSRSGGTVTLFSSGIDIADADANCILAYVQYLDDWLLGALMGHIGRGTKQLIRTWHPILLDDASVSSLPATQDAFITTVVARSDYRAAGA